MGSDLTHSAAMAAPKILLFILIYVFYLKVRVREKGRKRDILFAAGSPPQNVRMAKS